MKLDTKKIVVMRSDEAPCIKSVTDTECVIRRQEDIAIGEMTLLIFDHKSEVTSVMGKVTDNVRGTISVRFVNTLKAGERAFIDKFPLL